MATAQPAPTPSPDDPAQSLEPRPPLLVPYPADPQRTADTPYTATDAGAGVTTDSLQVWQSRRWEFGTFVRADLADVAGSAGPPYAGRPGAAPVAPTLVLTDDRGQQLALNGTPCGFDGEGPRAAARILVQEGLLTEQAALPAITSRHQLTVHRDAAAMPDAIALDPALLQLWSAQQRWREACARIDPRLPTDPQYPALAALLDRLDAAAIDAEDELALVGSVGPLPEVDPGQRLYLRLTAAWPGEVDLPTITDRQPQLTVHSAAPAGKPGVLADVLDPAQSRVTSAQRWHEACSAVDARLPDDPHYPALAAALDRLDSAGVHVQAAVALAASDGLPDAYLGRALHSRLTATYPAAVTPAPPPAPGGPAPAASTGRPPARPSAPLRTGPRL